ncbi:hypothetical protein AB0H82_06770 [Streptomyces sp. NPDC050732]|uniref:hypothetical protein n=1 Tax=Streptomyces sp. NPDC050732 TaxID=3154632 RepID=UPI00341210FC
MQTTTSRGPARARTASGASRWAAAALAVAALTGGALAAVPATAVAQPAQAPSMLAAERPPQENIPELEAGGAEQKVVFPPNNRHYDHPTELVVEAPPHTRITHINPNCRGMRCPVTISPDGKTARVPFESHNHVNSRPYEVSLQAENSAPLTGGTFQGKLTADGETKDLTVRIRPRPVVQVEGVTAAPGGLAVPKIIITNTTGERIGQRDVTLALGPGGLHWMGWQSVYTPRNGGTEEFKCRIDPNDSDKALCKDVNLNLDPGESIELRTIVGTYKSLKPCEVPRVNFSVDRLGAGDANFVMKDENGNPPVCPDH